MYLVSVKVGINQHLCFCPESCFTKHTVQCERCVTANVIWMQTKRQKLNKQNQQQTDILANGQVSRMARNISRLQLFSPYSLFSAFTETTAYGFAVCRCLQVIVTNSVFRILLCFSSVVTTPHPMRRFS